jgi:virulence-associated protein VagC
VRYFFERPRILGRITFPERLFTNGRSQAGRLPKEFRFKGTEVKIRKEGRKVILEPPEASDWPTRFWDIFTPDPEFESPKALSTKPFNLDEPAK